MWRGADVSDLAHRVFDGHRPFQDLAHDFEAIIGKSIFDGDKIPNYEPGLKMANDDPEGADDWLQKSDGPKV